MSKKTAAKFALDNVVRVRFGVKDPDFPDVPLGGWVGKITDVEAGNPPIYIIRWNQNTIAAMHPVYRNRCERDGLDFEEMRLGEDDLELDPGGAVILEQPTKIITPPLSMKDQDDRIRVVFGLTRDDILPEVDETSLRKYHSQLAENLTFPFTATWKRRSGSETASEIVTVIALNGFEDDPWCDESYGSVCKVRTGNCRIEVPLSILENVKGKPNSQIVNDYTYWFWNH